MQWEAGEEDGNPARPPEGHGFKLQGQECWEFTGPEARFPPNCEWVGVAAPVPAVGDGQHPGSVRMTLSPCGLRGRPACHTLIYLFLGCLLSAAHWGL